MKKILPVLGIVTVLAVGCNQTEIKEEKEKEIQIQEVIELEEQSNKEIKEEVKIEDKEDNEEEKINKEEDLNKESNEEKIIKEEDKNEIKTEENKKEEELNKETSKETTEKIKEENVKAEGQYIKKREYGSNVHIYITGKDEKIMPTLGQEGELEKLKNITLPKEVAKINLGLFDSTFEHGGMYMVDGEYKQPPLDRYSEIIMYKDGKMKIESFKNKEFAKSQLEKLKTEAEFVVAGAYPLIKNGEIDLGNANEYSHYNQKNPRSLIGQREDGRVILAVVEGRTKENKGVTALESAEIMKSLGAVEAINLDGGGSVGLYVDGEKKNQSNTVERRIGSAMIVVKK